MRQPDDPGPVYRKPTFSEYLVKRWHDDWNRNSRAILTAMGVCILMAFVPFLVLFFRVPPV